MIIEKDIPPLHIVLGLAAYIWIFKYIRVYEYI
jgi:hypothetical protein